MAASRLTVPGEDSSADAIFYHPDGWKTTCGFCRRSLDKNSESLDFIDEDAQTRPAGFTLTSANTNIQVSRMDSAMIFIVLLGCWSVSATRQSGSIWMVFSAGTQLQVNAGEETADDLHCQNKTTGSSVGPTVQILSSELHQDPGSPHLLVCLLTGLKSPVQNILWWVNDTVVTSAGATVSQVVSEEGRAYSASSVWEVSAADWSSRSTYWCGTIHEGRDYRQRLCSQEGL